MFLERVFQERRFVFLERRSSGAVLLERSVLCSKNAVLCSWNACSKNAVLCSWNACSKNACSRSTQLSGGRRPGRGRQAGRGRPAPRGASAAARKAPARKSPKRAPAGRPDVSIEALLAKARAAKAKK